MFEERNLLKIDFTLNSESQEKLKDGRFTVVMRLHSPPTMSSKHASKSRLSKLPLKNLRYTPDEWDYKRSRVKEGVPGAETTNQFLSELYLKVMEQQLKAQMANREFTGVRFLAAGRGLLDGGDFIAYATYKIEKRREHIAPSTYGQYKNTMAILARYGRRTFTQVGSPNFPTEFDEWMTRQGYAPNTRTTNHIFLKKYVSMAYTDGLIPDNPYKGFRLVMRPTKFNYLSASDMRRLMAIDYPIYSPLDIAKTYLMMSCCTGLRHSDLYRFFKNPESFLRRDGDVVELRLSAQKTDVECYVPISDIFSGLAIKLLNRYKWKVPVVKKEFLNEKLKIIGSDLGLQFSLSLHVGRHSFGTQLAANGANQYVIMAAMGLATDTLVKRYVHLSGVEVRRIAKTMKFQLTE